MSDPTLWDGTADVTSEDVCRAQARWVGSEVA